MTTLTTYLTNLLDAEAKATTGPWYYKNKSAYPHGHIRAENGDFIFERAYGVRHHNDATLIIDSRNIIRELAAVALAAEAMLKGCDYTKGKHPEVKAWSYSPEGVNLVELGDALAALADKVRGV